MVSEPNCALSPLSCKETASQVLPSFTAAYLGSGGHPWAQGVPSSSPQDYQELRAGQPGRGVCSLGTHRWSHVSSVSCSQRDCLLV